MCKPNREIGTRELLGCMRSGLDKLARENKLVAESTDYAVLMAELTTLLKRFQISNEGDVERRSLKCS